MNKKQTYKLYKAKKLWVTALAGVSMVAVEGAHQQAQADDVSSSQTTKKTTDTNESTSQQSQTASSQITNNQSTGSQSSVAQGLNPQSTAAQGLNPTSTTSQSAASQSTGTQQSSTSAGEQGAQQTATLQGTTTAQNQSQAASNTSSSTANNNNQSQSTSAGSGTQSQSTSTSSATQSQSQETGSTTDSSTAGSSTTDATSGSNQGSQSQATEQTLDLREATDSATNNTALLGANLTQGTTQPVTNDNLSVTVTKDNFLQWFKLGGDTTYDASTNTATLTPDIGGVEGNITLKTKINANDAFVLHGTINLGSKLQDAQGADGIGIAFHHGTVGEIGSLGGGISVLGLPTSSGYVFDTWPIDGGDHYDGKDSYVSGFHSDVDQKGQDSNIRYDGGFLDLDPTKYPVAGKAMPFTVTYDGNGHMGLDYLGHTFSIPVTDPQDPLALSIGASTGLDSNLQTVSVDSFTFDPAQNNTISRTINYVDKSGNKIASSTVQSAIYRRQGTLVNGQPTYTDWQLASGANSNNFAAVTAPTIAGYTIEGSQPTYFDSTTVNNDSGQLAYNVVYDKVLGQATLNVQDSTIVAGPTAQWSASQNFLSAVDQNGSAVDLSKVQVSGSVKTTDPGTYPIIYTYTDTSGKAVTKTANVTVVPSQSSLKAKDSTILVNSKWNTSDNVVSATDENGNILDLSKVQVSGNVDTSTPGVYPVTYSYTDASGNQHTQPVTVTVINSQSTLTVKDSTIFVNDSWKPADNVTAAKDEYGNPVDISKISVSGDVNTSKAGVYPVTYSYTDGQGKSFNVVAKVTVEDNQTQLQAKNSTLIAGLKTTWQPSDNLQTAIDADGKPLSIDQVQVSGSVNPQKPGTYQVTYSYTDQQGHYHSTPATITVLASQGSINATGSTIVAGPKAQWSAKDNFLTATDEHGNAVDFSQVQTTGTVDTKTPGVYPITYTYTDSQGTPFTKTINVTVVASKEGVVTKDETLIAGPKTQWQSKDDFVSAADANGNAVDLSQVAVSANVDTNTPGKYAVTYTYTDKSGNAIPATAEVTVLKSKAAVVPQDSTLIAGPNTTWLSKDNIADLLDEYGNSIDTSQASVSGSVNAQKPGTYSVTYSYTDGQGNLVSNVATITVVASQGSLTTQTVNLVAGPQTQWYKQQNLKSATDENGHPVNINQITVSGTVNPHQAGTYPLTYSYTDDQGNTYTQPTEVIVAASQAGIQTKDETIVAGPQSRWSSYDNMVKATDEDGNPLSENQVTVTGQADPSKVGTYTITYSYTDGQGNSITQPATVKVVQTQASISATDSTLIAGPNTKWNPASNFAGAKDENGQSVSYGSQISTNSGVDTEKPNTYLVIYSYQDAAGNTVSSTAKITVLASQGGVAAKDSTLIAGPNTKWTAADNFTSATDENGQPVDLSKVTVDGKVDPTTPGTYPVTYSYTDVQGNPYSKKVTVAVLASQGGVAAKDSTLIAGPNTKWTAADNFTSATDEDGKPVDLSKVTVDGSVDPTKAGSYPVTYSYTDAQGNPYSQKVTVTVVASQGGVAAKDSTLIAGPNTKWTAADNFSGATDEDGKPVDLSKVTVDGKVDPTTPGTYPVTYSYTDAQGNPYSKKITVTVVASQGGVAAKDSTMIAGPNTKWTAADNFTSATDENGKPVNLSKVKVDGKVDPTTPGTYSVTYSYTDAQGNPYSQKVTVTVNPSKGGVAAKDSTLIAGPNTKWTAADNFSGATDENGNPVDLSKVTVDGGVDTTKAGSYPVTYSYTDAQGNPYSQKITVTVVSSKGGVAAKDSTLIAGPNTKWTAADNFTGATDEDGKPVDLSKLTVDGKVDPTTPGTYPVTYSYTDDQGNPYSQKVTVTVNPSKGGVAAKDSTLIAGPNTKWTAADNFTSATDENGKPVDFSKVTVDGSVDPTKAGSYPVTYSYTDAQGNPYSQKVTVTVNPSKGGVAAKDSTLIAGPNTKWTAADNFSGATDEDDKPVDLSKVTVDGSVDPTKAGSYPVTYSYTDAQGNPYSQKVTVTVNPSRGGVAAKDSTLIAEPNTKWTAADNFTSATDENGKPVDLSKVTVDGKVDPTTPGTYPVTYSYTDDQGNPYSQKVTVTVNPSRGGVAAKDSTLIAGPNTKWTAADNFTSATDENGQPVDLSKVTVDGKVDPTTPGTYPVTYSYTDAQGNPYSQKVTVTVNPSRGGVAAKDSTLIAGPNTKWTAAD
ncbi:bacterial Ig-like domain-containing protein, partial [Fructobacillus tropaeoli]|uniref:bacterial Ig-like domain-containing protein n=1 Tax=Fructobacillus tropaeoli TaxID=709323 RepID=UPI0030C7AB95